MLQTLAVYLEQVIDSTSIELIKIAPSLLWFVLALIVLIIVRRPLVEEVIPRLSGLEFRGVKFSFVESRIDAALKLATETDDWKIDLSQTYKKRVLARVKRHQQAFRKAKFLWLDDHPENNIDERRLFRKLGVSIEIATTNQEALDLAIRGDHDLIISDIGRDNSSETGLQFLTQLRQKRVRTPLIFYVGNAEEGVPSGAQGLTDLPTRLLELTMDVLREVD